MNFEEAHKRWNLAMELRNFFVDQGSISVGGTVPLKIITKGIETGPTQTKKLLAQGPIGCGPMVFSLTETGKDVEYNVHDEEYLQSRQHLVVRWVRLLEKEGLEAVLETIAAFNLKTFDINLRHMCPTTDGWSVSFEAVTGEGETPSAALVHALERWAYGAPKVEGRAQVKKKRKPKRRRIELRR